MNYVDSEMVEEYINNEKEYIEQYDFENCKEDYMYLSTLSNEDIEDITQKINDDEELQDKITELIHYWVYHR